jgi:enterochelin esterase-like enzyme
MIGAWLLAMGLNGRGALHRYEIDAPELGDPHRAVRVYTPPGYDDQGAAERRYPVVYLLHGWPGSDGNWPGLGRAVVTADSLIASGRIPPVILVFPNGNGRGWFGRSLYLDSYDGTSRMHEFVARHLVGWVDSVFRTLPTPAFDRLVTSLGVPHTYVEYGGGHGWSYWRSHLAQSLIAVTAGMSDASLAERPAAPFESQATH